MKNHVFKENLNLIENDIDEQNNVQHLTMVTVAQAPDRPNNGLI